MSRAAKQINKQTVGAQENLKRKMEELSADERPQSKIK